MLKNLNDYLSLIVLVIFLINILRLFFGMIFIKQNEKINSNHSRFYLFLNYVDNEDE